MRWILFILLLYFAIQLVWFAIGQFYGPEYAEQVYKYRIVDVASSMRLIHVLILPILRHLLTLTLGLYSYAGALWHLAKSKRVVNPYFSDALALFFIVVIIVNKTLVVLGDLLTVVIMLYPFIMQLCKIETYSAPILSPIMHHEGVSLSLQKYIHIIGKISGFIQRKLIGKLRISQSVDSIV